MSYSQFEQLSHRSVLKMSVVSNRSGPPPQPSFGSNSISASGVLSVDEWFLGTSLVFAVVLAVAFGASRSVTIGAFTTASVALCVALVPWLWTVWLERRADRVA